MDLRRIRSTQLLPYLSLSLGYLSSHVAAEIIIHQYQPSPEDPDKDRPYSLALDPNWHCQPFIRPPTNEAKPNVIWSGGDAQLVVQTAVGR